MSTTQNEYPVVRLTWLDSATVDQTWIFKDQGVEIDKITTVAFVVREDDESITICHSYGTAQVSGVLTIPKCSITERIDYDEEE